MPVEPSEICERLHMGDGAPEIINVNEKENSIYFNGGINSRSMSSLIEKLLDLERAILSKQRRLKLKIKEMKKENEKMEKGYRDEDSDIESQVAIEIKPKPIKLYITSNGGAVFQVFSAIDTIQSMKIPVHTICKGFVASAGTLLSLAGKKRYITENSYMLIHELRTAAWGKFTHMAESFENSKQLMEHIKTFYLRRTHISAEELDEQLKKDICWNAEVCLEKGLVDEIIRY